MPKFIDIYHMYNIYKFQYLVKLSLGVLSIRQIFNKSKYHTVTHRMFSGLKDKWPDILEEQSK